ncbi:hypothetical protein TH66_04340 [Carbonactinospora thermoautotrophica]|uniref:Uncharacterized protein n=1 Tax=Carbonactinospora thermoautotrophica TaxID=1469144 RepID=A0A132N4D1_9ACTN|nr:hypothetical protein [Carbonactinospora thermoautotrophica]KWX04998.1 hypothetical protein TH66_04340 [Carbonactinospora thermoautotrophica]KWX07322.1 hypothetical protein TR74_19120 [Carbonactinospora thermoautotrophica]
MASDAACYRDRLASSRSRGEIGDPPRITPERREAARREPGGLQCAIDPMSDSDGARPRGRLLTDLLLDKD